MTTKRAAAIVLAAIAVLGIGLLLAPRASKPRSRSLDPGSTRAVGRSPSATAAGAAARAPEVSGPNVLLISIDTLRADALGSYGHLGNPTPTLDRLANEGVRFEQAYATASWTAPSMASVMTGLYPSHHGVTRGVVTREAVTGQQTLPADVTLLAERFAASGYRTYGLVANGHLDARFGFARGFAHYTCVGFASSPRVLEQLESFVTELRAPASAPYFFWLHLIDPHSPYLAFPPYVQDVWGKRPRHLDLEGVTPADAYSKLGLSGERLDYVKMLYQSEVNYADTVVRTVLERTGALEAARGTVVIALSDHGEELLDHGRFGHGHNLFEESVRVPFIIRLPERAFAGKAITTPVSLVDVMPTLVSIAGLAPLDAGTRLEGEDLWPLVRGTAEPPERALLAELARGQRHKAVIERGLKLIRDERLGRASLYDLAADPLEQRDLRASRAADGAALETRLAALLGAAPVRDNPIAPIERPDIEALKAMGYVQ